MLKYIALIVGLILLFCSIQAWVTYEPISEEPVPLELAAACDLRAAPDVQYVTIAAQPDADRRLFYTGMTRPQFTAKNPERIHPLTLSDASDNRRLESLLGCMVQIEGFISPAGLGVMQEIIQYDDGTPDEVQSEKYIAPLAGTDDRLLVLSRTFTPNSGDGDRWAARTSFTGRLSRFADLKANATGVTHSPSELRSHLQGFGTAVPSDAFVILTEKNAVTGYSRHVVPLIGAGETLFAELTDAEERQLATDGSFTGLLKVRDASRHPSLGEALETPLPDRIGWLTCDTAAGYNAGHRAMYAFGLICGLFLTVLGGGTIWLKRYLRKRQQQRFAATAGTISNQWRDAA